MFGLPWKIAVFCLVLVFSNVFAQNAQNQKLSEIRLSGPGAFLSLPLIYMAESGALNDIAEKNNLSIVEKPRPTAAFCFRPKNGFHRLAFQCGGEFV